MLFKGLRQAIKIIEITVFHDKKKCPNILINGTR